MTKKKKPTKEDKEEAERKKAEKFRNGAQCPGKAGSNGRYGCGDHRLSVEGNTGNRYRGPLG